MCSRFEVNASSRDLTRRYGFNDIPTDFTTGEVRPTNPALMIAAGGPRVMRWGLRVDWNNKPLINARGETLAEKSTFRPLLKNRCLVLATAYFEWRRDEGRKIKTRIHNISGDLFATAGLTDGDNFTIVTVAPAAAIAQIHSRMPVIIDANSEASWLDPDLEFTAAVNGLAPASDDRLGWHDADPPSRQKNYLIG